MRNEAQISMHLLIAGVVSGFSIILILITLAMNWELWTIPLVGLGCLAVWWLHIGRIGSEKLYENMCAGLMLGEFFFFGVHATSLVDIPTAVCILFFLFSLLNRKGLLYIAASLYVLELLYHFLFLNTITFHMGVQDAVHLGIGTAVAAGAVTIVRYRINRRTEEKERYGSILAQLDAAGRQNADFLSNVSHELRTPVNMVIGISEVALDKKTIPEIHEDIQSIQLAGKRLSSQINNILDYTEIVEGTLTAEKEKYSLISVINDVITMTAVQSSRNHLEMVFDIDPRIPSVLVGDAEKISHVLKILLENSIKFTEEGGVNICIGFRPEGYGINLVIDIYDTGIGMTQAQLKQMYADFYQADSGSRRYAGGLGLGIPIARGLLHSMGGFIHFDSKEQQGLQAHIIIPQGVEDDTPSMEIYNPNQFCIACYFRPERYNSDDVRRYYDNMILHMVEGLGVEGYQAHNFEGLQKLQREHHLTHIFMAQTEYEENRAYYEELARTLSVIVIAGRKFVPGSNSRILVIRKPFFSLSIVNILNGQTDENGAEKLPNTARRPFFCEGIRALAVDDEEMNLVVAKGVLGSYGIKVDTCLSGRAAVEQCRHTSYDLVFLDHMMPGFDGVETLRRIREINNGMYQDLPVIALTANTISGAREMFKSEGFTEFIPKPIERSVLERVLRRVLPERSIRHNGSTAGAETPEDTFLPPSSPETEIPDAAHSQETAVPGQMEDQPYAALSKAGINIQMGMDYCCGDEDFYLEMLRMFHTQAADKENELISLYEAANWGDYAIKVHALKSTALTIGAEQLSARAKELEQAGKSGNEEYIRKNHPILLDMYREVCGSMEGL